MASEKMKRIRNLLFLAVALMVAVYELFEYCIIIASRSSVHLFYSHDSILISFVTKKYGGNSIPTTFFVIEDN